jgi:hypothetical protein
MNKFLKKNWRNDNYETFVQMKGRIHYTGGTLIRKCVEIFSSHMFKFEHASEKY